MIMDILYENKICFIIIMDLNTEFLNDIYKRSDIGLKT